MPAFYSTGYAAMLTLQSATLILGTGNPYGPEQANICEPHFNMEEHYAK